MQIGAVHDEAAAHRGHPRVAKIVLESVAMLKSDSFGKVLLST